tara:strand:- start:16170 stop:16559 length:390 start_codon:yes stop_codon:yes gene_type:complete
MKSCALTIAVILLVSAASGLSQEAPGAEAFRKVKQARENLSKAEADLQSAIQLITPSENQAAAKATLARLTATWSQLIELDSSFQESASPLPSGATSTGLIAYNVEVHFNDLQAKRYRDWAAWIRANYE